MTTNRQLTATWTYHNGTKHSWESIRSDPHSLDWKNYPLAFKMYATLDPVPLPHEWPPVSLPTLSAIAGTSPEQNDECIPDLLTLAKLLFLSAGITKRRTHAGGEMYFRAAACTGALYHIDLYLVCGQLPDLSAGVYHFGPNDFALRCLRPGDYRQVLIQASGQEPAVACAPALLVCTSTYWRNAWKYQARTYRHCFWDAGTLLANTLAAGAGLKLPIRIVAGFADSVVNQLLDLDTDREVALALVPVGSTTRSGPDTPPAIEPLQLPTVPSSKTEVDYPAIRVMHAASTLTQDEVLSWRGALSARAVPPCTGRLFPLVPPSAHEFPDTGLEHVIRHRGSSRAFAPEAITLAQLSAMLQQLTCGVPADCLDPFGATFTALYLIVNAVDALPSGSYVFHREQNALEVLREGDFRGEAGHLGLGQELPADASVNIFCLVELPPLLERFGNRGYRAAQLESAIIGGKVYLAAYGQRLGATGLTFFDDEVTQFFSPHAAGKSVMFLMAVGKPVKRRLEIQK